MSQHNYFSQRDFSSFTMPSMDGPVSMTMEPQAVNDRMLAMSDSIFNFLDLNLEPDPMSDGGFRMPLAFDDGSQLASPDEQRSTSTPDGADPPTAALVRGPPQVTKSSGGGGAHTVSDFTKKKNWPAILMAEMRDLLQVLDTNGRFTYLSDSVTSITGYTAEDLRNTMLKDLVHSDDVPLLISELNDTIASGSSLRLYYRFRKKDGSYMMFEATGHAHIAKPKFSVRASNQSAFCQAVLMIARPYPSVTAHRLDSFLDHTMENERLHKRIAELRSEEEADIESLQQDSKSEYSPSEYTMSSTGTAVPTVAPGPPATPSSSDLNRNLNPNLTQENIEASGSAQATIGEKMARFAATSHAAEIERLTGIRWAQIERANEGLSPRMVKGDQGIEIPVDRDPRAMDKKTKKLKVTVDEYMCTDCGTLDSPEWRKGPMGPKSLCNACGLRWAKKEKKSRVGGSSSKGDQSGMG